MTITTSKNLFGTLQGAEIKDLNIRSNASNSTNVFSESELRIGILANKAEGVKVSNVKNYCSLITTDQDRHLDYRFIGGLFGSVDMLNGTNSIIIGCENNGEISDFSSVISRSTDNNQRATVCVGGICGYANGNTIIANCKNNNVIISSNYPAYLNVGGIAGYIAENSNISHCINSNLGIVRINFGSPIFSNFSLGGIVGKNKQSIVEYSINYADVYDDYYNTFILNNESHESRIGGIVGNLENAEVLSSENHGRVVGKFYLTHQSIGGIVGYGSGQSSNFASIQHCNNYGIVAIRQTSSSSKIISLGGIIGFGYLLQISFCYDEGNVGHFTGNAISFLGTNPNNGCGFIAGYLKGNYSNCSALPGASLICPTAITGNETNDGSNWTSGGSNFVGRYWQMTPQ